VYGLPPDPVVTTKHLGAMWRNMTTAAAVLAVGIVGAFAGGRS
jgi:formate dehydrogenase iron-sulfur subunit